MPYDWVHMAKMARPKKVHPFYIPDRASVYWLDYLIDPTPHTITDPVQLKEYYENEAKKFPSAVRLSKPKLYDEEGEDKTSKTCQGHPRDSRRTLYSETSSKRSCKEPSTFSDVRPPRDEFGTPSSNYSLNSSKSASSSTLSKISSIRLDGPKLEFLGQGRRGRGRGDYQKANYRSPSPLIARCKSAVKDAEISRFQSRRRPPVNLSHKISRCKNQVQVMD